MKILIAVPTFETIQPEVFKAIYDLRPAGHDLAFDFVKGYDCAVARNRIGKMAQEGGYDYVLMVDSDTIIPPDALELMLDTPVDICLGVCPRKNTSEKKTAMIKFGDNSYHDSYFYPELPEGKLEEIREAAINIFKACDCFGFARVDFFLEKDTNRVVFNEINTIPGHTSISMYYQH